MIFCMPLSINFLPFGRMHPDGAFHFNPARYDIPLRASADCSDSNDKRIQRIIVSGNIGLQVADYGTRVATSASLPVCGRSP